MLMRNFIFRTNYLPTRSPHQLLWRHLLSRQYQKYRYRYFKSPAYTPAPQSTTNDSEHHWRCSHHNHNCQQLHATPDLIDDTHAHQKAVSQQQQQQSNYPNHTTIDIEGDEQIRQMNGGNQLYSGHKRHAFTYHGQQQGAACGALARNKRRILIVLTVGTTATVDTLLWQSFGWMCGLPAMFAALFVIMLVTLGWRWFYIAAVTCRRDFT